MKPWIIRINAEHAADGAVEISRRLREYAEKRVLNFDSDHPDHAVAVASAARYARLASDASRRCNERLDADPSDLEGAELAMDDAIWALRLAADVAGTVMV